MIQADDKRKDYDLAKIRTMLERCGVIVTEARPSEFVYDKLNFGFVLLTVIRLVVEFNPKNIEQDLARLLNAKSLAQALREWFRSQCYQIAFLFMGYFS